MLRQMRRHLLACLLSSWIGLNQFYLSVQSFQFQTNQVCPRHLHHGRSGCDSNGRHVNPPVSIGSSAISSGTSTMTALFHYRARFQSSSGNVASYRSSIASSSRPSTLIGRRGLFGSFTHRFLNPFRRLYKYIVKRFFRRYTVYILQCENDKYYVGSTSNRRQRFKEHSSPRGGSAWTRTHRPVRVLREYRNIPPLYVLGLEASVTALCMLEYGVHNVRGAMFSEPRPYTIDDLQALTGFIGHYNELDYSEVALRLERELLSLPPSSRTRDFGEEGDDKKKQRKRKKKRNIKTKNNDRCFNCGERGHWASDCPKMWGNSDDISGHFGNFD